MEVELDDPSAPPDPRDAAPPIPGTSFSMPVNFEGRLEAAGDMAAWSLAAYRPASGVRSLRGPTNIRTSEPIFTVVDALYSRRSPASVKFTQSDRFGYSLAATDPRKRLFRVIGIIDNWAGVSGGCGQGDWPNPAGGPTIPRSQLGG